MMGNTLFYFGEFAPAREHFEQSMALYDSRQHHSHAFLYGQDTGVVCLARAAWVLWFLGYPDQALKLSHKAIALAQELSHPHSLAYALRFCCHTPSASPGGTSSPRAGRGGHDTLDRAGVSILGGVGNYPAGLGAGRARARRGGDFADTPGHGRLSGHGGRGCHGLIFLLYWPRRMRKQGRSKRG